MTGDGGGMPNLETERLALRPMTLDDAPFIVALLNDEAFLRYIGDRGVRTEDDARRYITDGPMASCARFGFGLCVVERREDRASIGICGLLKRDTLDAADIGFAFLPAFRQNGYGFEAATAVLDDARRRLGLGRVVAITSPENTPSMRLLTRLGFLFERVIRLTPTSPEVKLFARDTGDAAAS